MSGFITQIEINQIPGNSWIQIRFPENQPRTGFITYFAPYGSNSAMSPFFSPEDFDVGTENPLSSFSHGGYTYYNFAIPYFWANHIPISFNDENFAFVYRQGDEVKQIIAFGNGDNYFKFEDLLAPYHPLHNQWFQDILANSPNIVMGGGLIPIDPSNKTTTFVINPSDNSVQVDVPADPNQPCFLSGTLIATPAGEVPVEELRAGDLVLTADGGVEKIRWVGRVTLARRFADPLHGLPVRIKAGALGEGLPRRDLLVSPGHAMFLDGVLVNAGALVNGVTILRETRVAETFQYFHIELDRHALLLAEGAPTESFLDAVENGRFDNGAERPAWPPGTAMPELPYPRAITARQVPPGIRRRLAALAAEATPAAA